VISKLFSDLHRSGADNHITRWGITQAKFEDAYLNLLADDRKPDSRETAPEMGASSSSDIRRLKTD
jgi:hypothetical protein